MTTLTLTLVQMDCRLGKPGYNFERAELFVAEAARRGSDLVVLPELWSTAYDLENAADHATPVVADTMGNGWFGRLAQLASSHDVWLAGSILELGADGKIYNCLALYSPEGKLAGAYRKIHLFRLMDEDQFLAPGPETVTVDLPWGRVGLAICYDLRFPELFRRYALAGAKLILLPAEWPHPRRDHWRTLLRARAIENQMFVAGCNRVGSSKGSDFFGASALIDPWGEALIEGGEQETLLTVTLDLDQVDAVRQRIPIFEDRRPGLY